MQTRRHADTQTHRHTDTQTRIPVAKTFFGVEICNLGLFWECRNLTRTFVGSAKSMTFLCREVRDFFGLTFLAVLGLVLA